MVGYLTLSYEWAVCQACIASAKALDIFVKVADNKGMARTISTKELKRLIQGLESQGCRTKAVKGGYQFFPPNNGRPFTLHLTLSDGRGMLNLRADARRANLSWPLDS